MKENVFAFLLYFILFLEARFSVESDFQWVLCTIHRTHNFFLIKTFIKNRFYDIIHTFKNYFVTVFSIFNFQFLTK